MTPSAFESAIAERIATAGVAFETNVPLEGLQADFVLQADNGEQLVLEAKSWQATPANARRAANQARLIRKLSGPGAFVVVSDEFDSTNLEGVVRLADVTTLVHTYKCDWKPSGILPQKVDRTIFAAMPFAEEYDDVFFVAMVTAAKKVGASAKRVDREPFEGDIVERIRKLIDQSSAVFADLSDARPNVFYELGYAQGLGRPTITLSSSALTELPFDVRNWNVLAYKKGKTYELADRLAERLASVFAGSS
jgi:hypothetical protein